MSVIYAYVHNFTHWESLYDNQCDTPPEHTPLTNGKVNKYTAYCQRFGIKQKCSIIHTFLDSNWRTTMPLYKILPESGIATRTSHSKYLEDRRAGIWNVGERVPCVGDVFDDDEDDGKDVTVHHKRHNKDDHY